MTLRTRMAPSPTGEYHIGGMRTLLYNYALAKKSGGSFVLRIEDTDRERFVDGATERLIKAIYAYGLTWDEGPDVGGDYAPYTQSERLDLYKKYAQELVSAGHAYYCFCTKDRLEELRSAQQEKGYSSTRYDKHCLSLSREEIEQKLAAGESYVIRLNVPKDETVHVTDAVLGSINFPTNDIDDQVLLKSDGFPTYHLAVVVDDHLMNITHILRGVEWLPSTPKHVLLYNAFKWDIPVYAHLPLLKEKGDSKKLSKRMGSVGALEFLQEGYLPEALLNFLMFLGWNPGGEKEIYSLDEFVQEFSLEKVHKTDLVVFDRDKLLWYNGHYIRSKSPQELFEILKTWAREFEVAIPLAKDDAFNLGVIVLVHDRLKTLNEYKDLVSYFFERPVVDMNLLSSQAVDQARVQKILTSFLDLFEEIIEDNWTKDALDSASHKLLEKEQFKSKEAFMSVRVAVTGSSSTPPIFDVLALLGKNEVLGRVKNSLEMLY